MSGCFSISGRRNLIATRCSSLRCIAATTTPIPPAPSTRSTLYLSLMRLPSVTGALIALGVCTGRLGSPTPAHLRGGEPRARLVRNSRGDSRGEESVAGDPTPRKEGASQGEWPHSDESVRLPERKFGP